MSAIPESLKDRVAAIIAPWEQDPKLPPFTEVQLVVMALLISSPKPLTPRNAAEWIVGHLAYYKTLAFESLWQFGARHAEATFFRMNVEKAFRLYDTPFQAVEDQAYTVSGIVGELALSNILKENKVAAPMTSSNSPAAVTTAFPFLRLPAELRNTIYKLAVQYPRSGMSFGGLGCKHARVLSDIAEQDSQTDIGQARNDQLLITRPITEILSILLVSRQVRREALPVFYATNHFYFRGLRSLGDHLRRIPESHRNHITHLSFDLHLHPHTPCEDEVEILRRLQRLRSLSIRCDEMKWLANEGRVAGIREVQGMPGVYALQQLRGLEEVKFSGGCPRLEALLKADMLRPKAQRRKVVDEKGRKREVADVAQADVQKPEKRTRRTKA